MERNRKLFLITAAVICVAWFSLAPAMADDTDIYKPKVRHNVVVLLDTSGSMAWPVYDADIDFYQFYQDVCDAEGNAVWDDDYGTSAQYYNEASPLEPTKLYVIHGDTGFLNGVHGDVGNPAITWEFAGVVDTLTYVDASGNLADAAGLHPGDTGYSGHVTTSVNTDGDTVVSWVGNLLPYDRSIKLHDWRENPDNSRMDAGFMGMMRAPGSYFMGYLYDTDQPWFLATGNWINFMKFQQILYEHKNNDWDYAWKYLGYSGTEHLTEVPFSLESPNYPSDYPKSYDSMQDPSVDNTIYNGEAGKMRIHFADLVLGDKDYIQLYDENGDKSGSTITTLPANGWSAWVTGRQIVVQFVSNKKNTVARGWHIDKYEYGQTTNEFKIESRLEIGTKAMIDVVETTRGKINWGLMYFNNGDGAFQALPMNPSFNDDQQKQSIINKLEDAVALGGTPLGEALQDTGEYFHDKTNQIHKDCNKNFVITLTDGYPSVDTDWSRMSNGVTFTDTDSVRFYGDPAQNQHIYEDYYDEVAKWMYTHSYVDWSAVDAGDRPSSPDNIHVHNIGFNVDNPMLEHASNEAGGLYLTAYSKSQLVNAFYSLGLLIAEYSSYTAPVVSVDEANRVQSGDKLYMALFKPKEDLLWTGNLKKYGLTFGIPTGCPDQTEDWFVVDKNNNAATTCDGTMVQESSSFWSSRNDGGEVELGGVGEVLYNSVPSQVGLLTQSTIQSTLVGGIPFRNIYTSTSSADNTLKRVATDSLTNAELQVTLDADRYKIINQIYGYTYDAHTAASALLVGNPAVEGAPVIKNSWPLGAIIHSAPQLIDYFDSNFVLTHRYVAVGSNDGMLHVFDDTDGREIFSFVPYDVLSRFKEFDPTAGNTKVYMVDGSPILVKDSSGNRLLVFGLRRGGRAYYAINVTDTDPDNWTLAWSVSNLTTGMEELGLTFATPQEARIKTGTVTDVNGFTSDTYKSFLVIPGGYATNEDKSTAEDDYELTPSHNSNMGRAIYLLDTDTGLPLSSAYLVTDVAMPVGQSQFVAPDATWVTANSTELLAQMRFCFAADPTIILGTDGYFKVAYISDLYGQVWKLAYELDESASPAAYKFNLYLIFKANPRSDQLSAYENRNTFLGWSPGDADPRGTIGLEADNSGNVVNPRKTFFSPDVSFAGNCYTDVPVLYLGTGDREHPTFIGSSTGGNERVHNALYGFYDAQAYSKIVLKQSSYANPTSNDPGDSGFLNGCYSEKDLLNVTCGAMEPDMTVFANATDNNNVKSDILSFLATESKGYYTRISEFGGCPDEGDNADHYGEKAISPVTIFAKKVFAPTYQPVLPAANNDPCIYDGVARLWAVDYCTGNAVYNFYTGNDTTTTDPSTGVTTTDPAYKRRDRYLDIGSHIPSGLSIIVREGDATGFISVGGQLKTPADIDLPLGMLPLYWREVYDVD